MKCLGTYNTVFSVLMKCFWHSACQWSPDHLLCHGFRILFKSKPILISAYWTYFPIFFIAFCRDNVDQIVAMTNLCVESIPLDNPFIKFVTTDQFFDWKTTNTIPTLMGAQRKRGHVLPPCIGRETLLRQNNANSTCRFSIKFRAPIWQFAKFRRAMNKFQNKSSIHLPRTCCCTSS